MEFKKTDPLEIASEQNEERYYLKLDIDDPEKAIEIISQIEGEGWKNKQKNLLNVSGKQDEPEKFSIYWAQKALQNIYQHIENLHRNLASEQNPSERELIEGEIKEYEDGFGPRIEIYGSGGGNRYYILSNGEIVMPESFMMGMKKNQLKQLAEQLGIHVI
jgi:hypothetical protein